MHVFRRMSMIDVNLNYMLRSNEYEVCNYGGPFVSKFKCYIFIQITHSRCIQYSYSRPAIFIKIFMHSRCEIFFQVFFIIIICRFRGCDHTHIMRMRIMYKRTCILFCSAFDYGAFMTSLHYYLSLATPTCGCVHDK